MSDHHTLTSHKNSQNQREDQRTSLPSRRSARRLRKEKNLRRISQATLFATLGLLVAASPLLASCSQSKEQARAEEKISLSTVYENNPDQLLPHQDQIKEKQSFAYLIANPTIESFSAYDLMHSQTRSPASLTENAEAQPENTEDLKESCAPYQQVAPELIATPAPQTTVLKDGVRRHISLGQSDIDQVSGYNGILRAKTAEEAEQLWDDFTTHPQACSQALVEAEPGVETALELTHTSVDQSTKTATLHGTYRGETITIVLAQKDRYLVSTWFRALGSSCERQLDEASTTLETLTLTNMEAFA